MFTKEPKTWIVIGCHNWPFSFFEKSSLQKVLKMNWACQDFALDNWWEASLETTVLNVCIASSLHFKIKEKTVYWIKTKLEATWGRLTKGQRCLLTFFYLFWPHLLNNSFLKHFKQVKVFTLQWCLLNDGVVIKIIIIKRLSPFLDLYSYFACLRN